MAGLSGTGAGDPREPDELEAALLSGVEDAVDAGRRARVELGALEGRAFLNALSDELRATAELLERLLSGTESDLRWHSLHLEGAGAAVRIEPSNLRLRLGCDPALEPTAGAAAEDLVRRSGNVVDLQTRHLPSGSAVEVAAVFGGGLRLHLVVQPATALEAVPPGGVVLHDPGGTLRRVSSPTRVDAEQARVWLFDGWWALDGVATDIGRGRFLQAVEGMAGVRAGVCRLWAVGEGVTDPAAGLAGLVADPAARTPKGLEVLMPRPLPGDLRTAALSAADLLHEAANHAGRRLGAVPRTPLEAAVRRRLGARR